VRRLFFGVSLFHFVRFILISSVLKTLHRQAAARAYVLPEKTDLKCLTLHVEEFFFYRAVR